MTISESINYICASLDTDINDDAWVALATSCILLSKYNITKSSSVIEQKIKKIGQDRGIDLETHPQYKEVIENLNIINNFTKLKKYKP